MEAEGRTEVEAPERAEHDLDVEPEETMSPNGSEAAPEDAANLLGKLRERREELRQERSIVMDIPGYGGDLVVRYRPVEWKVLRRLAEKVEKSKNEVAELYAAADAIAKACDEVMIRVAEDEYRPVSPDGEPCGYDEKLALALGFEADTARKVVFGVFNNNLALTAHYQKLEEWMSGVTEDVDEEFAGESDGTS